MDNPEAAVRSKKLAEALVNSSDMFKSLRTLEKVKNGEKVVKFSEASSVSGTSKEDEALRDRIIERFNKQTSSKKVLNFSESADTGEIKEAQSVTAAVGWPEGWGASRESFSSEADSTFSYGMESLLNNARDKFMDLTGLTMPSLPDTFGSEGVDIEGAFFLCKNFDNEYTALLPADRFLEMGVMTYMLEMLTGPVEVDVDLSMPRSITLKTKGFVSVCALREATIKASGGKKVKVNLVTKIILVKGGKKRLVVLESTPHGTYSFMFVVDPRLRTTADC